MIIAILLPMVGQIVFYLFTILVVVAIAVALLTLLGF